MSPKNSATGTWERGNPGTINRLPLSATAEKRGVVRSGRRGLVSFIANHPTSLIRDSEKGIREIRDSVKNTREIRDSEKNVRETGGGPGTLAPPRPKNTPSRALFSPSTLYEFLSVIRWATFYFFQPMLGRIITKVWFHPSRTTNQ